MTKGERVEVELVLHDGVRAPGFVRIQELSESESRKAGLKFFLTCFAASLVMVIVPPHFIWLFGLLTVGTIGYIVKSKQRSIKLGGEAECPKCKSFQILDPGTSEIPFLHFCEKCGARSEAYKKGEVPEELFTTYTAAP